MERRDRPVTEANDDLLIVELDDRFEFSALPVDVVDLQTSCTNGKACTAEDTGCTNGSGCGVQIE